MTPEAELWIEIDAMRARLAERADHVDRVEAENAGLKARVAELEAKLRTRPEGADGTGFYCDREPCLIAHAALAKVGGTP